MLIFEPFRLTELEACYTRGYFIQTYCVVLWSLCNLRFHCK